MLFQKLSTIIFLQAPNMLSTTNLAKGGKDNKTGSKLEPLYQGFTQVHESCANLGEVATPRRYISFLSTYQDIYLKKKDAIVKKHEHLQVSIERKKGHTNLQEYTPSSVLSPLRRHRFVCVAALLEIYH